MMATEPVMRYLIPAIVALIATPAQARGPGHAHAPRDPHVPHEF
jgi:hypothetical protein